MNDLHVDDFVKFGVNEHDKKEIYARWVLHHFRLEPLLKVCFAEIMRDHKLFCDYRNEKYKVVGATWSGKVWLSLKFDTAFGYDRAVFVEDCSNWSDK